MADDKPMWARLPNETEAAFNVFNKYLRMLDDPDITRRSLRTLAIDLGYKSEKSLEKWSSANRWVERAKGYDSYLSVAIVQREIHDLGGFQDHVVEKLSEQIAMLDVILDQELMSTLKAQEKGQLLKTSDLKRLVDSVKAKDDLARRLARMPTNYTTVQADDDDEQHTFIIGGGDG